jgi:hypothetical protein
MTEEFTIYDGKRKKYIQVPIEAAIGDQTGRARGFVAAIEAAADYRGMQNYLDDRSEELQLFLDAEQDPELKAKAGDLVVQLASIDALTKADVRYQRAFREFQLRFDHFFRTYLSKWQQAHKDIKSTAGKSGGLASGRERLNKSVKEAVKAHLSTLPVERILREGFRADFANRWVKGQIAGIPNNLTKVNRDYIERLVTQFKKELQKGLNDA